ncbi:uncharacterized protein CC84DRAFT_415504 [Paraphaeosphaeria sporulosa]|uniref:Uncharacterized protein n=1 Tax=Paraphaeosphaeria sporulosa TaxID=1460663 RepID=A0A177BWD3_9PLEO|nr:uncharacterized protein CC84DRAFT_415504 [Paraphaeosphaeria sporulosa]OAF99051.1 hypothetical protein CC84DRAFT_415504 [Paraphaeosphaeria sporulosa]
MRIDSLSLRRVVRRCELKRRTMPIFRRTPGSSARNAGRFHLQILFLIPQPARRKFTEVTASALVQPTIGIETWQSNRDASDAGTCRVEQRQSCQTEGRTVRRVVRLQRQRRCVNRGVCNRRNSEAPLRRDQHLTEPTSPSRTRCRSRECLARRIVCTIRYAIAIGHGQLRDISKETHHLQRPNAGTEPSASDAAPVNWGSWLMPSCFNVVRPRTTSGTNKLTLPRRRDATLNVLSGLAQRLLVLAVFPITTRPTGAVT